MPLYQLSRVGGGPSNGLVRVVVEVDLSYDEELCLAALLGTKEYQSAVENLALSPRKRGLGRGADVAAAQMINGLSKALGRGAVARSKIEKSRKSKRKTGGRGR